MTDTAADTTANDDLPRWDLSSYFPSLDSREFAAAHESLTAGVQRLEALYDEHDVRDGAGRVLDADTVAAFDEVVARTNDVFDEMRLVNAFIHAHVTTDARDDRASALASELRRGAMALGPLAARFDAWVAALGGDALIAASPTAEAHAHRLRKATVGAEHQMSEAEENLGAELNLSGGSAWAQLWGDITGRLTAAVTMPSGSIDILPITVVRNLALSPDAATRRAGYEAELAAWESASVPLAAAMNGVKGQASTLNRRRGWPDDLEPSLFANSVDRDTLDAMQRAVVESLPAFRRYLQAKAGWLGSAAANGGMPWWDLFAPVGPADAATVSWGEACDAVRTAFGSYSPALLGLADRAFAERWIDAGPRDGKRGGAYCMPMQGEESRILANFSDSLDGVSTLAHELGHAYHNVTLADRTAMQRALPMALAETASIFCETILVQALLADARAAGDADRQLALLDTDLVGATQVVVDIHSRFLFERDVFSARAARSLSVAELCSTMADAQRASYGDGLDADFLHPYMWAAKPHYYQTAFYNWPYTFGLLFGIGLYARYTEDPDRFRAGYDDLLSSVGMGAAAELAARFGIDVHDEAFWASSLQVLADRIDEFVALARSAPT